MFIVLNIVIVCYGIYVKEQCLWYIKVNRQTQIFS